MTAPPGVVSGESPSAHGVAIPPHLPAQGMSQDASPREAVSVLVCFASRSRLLVPSGLRPSGLLLLYSGEFSSLSSAFSGFPSEALVGHVLEPLPLSSRLSFCEVLAFCAVLHRYLVESPSGSSPADFRGASPARSVPWRPGSSPQRPATSAGFCAFIPSGLRGRSQPPWVVSGGSPRSGVSAAKGPRCCVLWEVLWHLL